MDFQLTEEQALTRQMARDLAAAEIAPIAAEIDETGHIPAKVMEEIARAGLFGVLIPPPFGGAGGEQIDFTLVVEEIGAASASVAWSMVTSICVGFLILVFGSDEQRHKYLPALAKGEKLAGYSLVEPSGGTNWQQTLRTRAAVEGEHYVLNGAKCFCSNAGEADLYAVFARTSQAPGPQGVSVMIVETGTPGFGFGTREDKFGLRGDPTGELIFEDCRVPKENLLGQEGGALPVFQANGGLDCLGQAALCTGLAQAALDAASKYVQERTVVAPSTLAHLPNVQRDIADMTVAVEAARLITYRAAFPIPGGPDPIVMMSAMFANEVALEVTGKAVALHGGYGCMRDFPVGRYFRDAKTISLQKTPEMVKMMSGMMMLGIPMGPPPPGG